MSAHKRSFGNTRYAWLKKSALTAGLEVDPSRLFYRLSAISGSLCRVARHGWRPWNSLTKMLPTPDEHASDDASHYAPTSRANSQVAREPMRKGQALNSQGPESLRSRSDQGRPGRFGAGGNGARLLRLHPPRLQCLMSCFDEIGISIRGLVSGVTSTSQEWFVKNINQRKFRKKTSELRKLIES